MRRAAECLLLVSGVLVCMYGLFAVLYEGDAGGSETTVSVGAVRLTLTCRNIAFLVGLLLIGLAVWSRRRRRSAPA